MTTFLWFTAGWFCGAFGVAIVIGAAIAWCDDYTDHKTPPVQPAGVRDPETALLWDEQGVLRTKEWYA